MKILVTGMTSRQCNPKASTRDVTFAWLLSEALRDAGHEVEHRDPNVEEDLSDFDHAFVGLGPLHGMGTNRSYGALAGCLRMWGDKLTIILDDEDTGKVLGGLRTVLGDPDKRFTKDFFVYKRDWAIAKEEPWRSWLLSGAKMLHENAWPQLIVPAFPWCNEQQIAMRVPQAAHNTHTIDLSAYLPVYESKEVVPREQVWVTETDPSLRWFRQQRLVLPAEIYGKDHEKRPKDPQLVQRYRDTWGVVNLNPELGWWTSRMGFAAQAGALYITRWQDVEHVGQAYALLPEQGAAMDPALRDQWAEAQRIAFEAASSSKEQVKEKLGAVLEPAAKETNA